MSLRCGSPSHTQWEPEVQDTSLPSDVALSTQQANHWHLWFNQRKIVFGHCRKSGLLLFLEFKKYTFVYLLGCVGSEPQHAGSSLHRAGSFMRRPASSCSAWAQSSMAREVPVPRPGVRPASLAVPGGFSTTGPPGTSLFLDF